MLEKARHPGALVERWLWVGLADTWTVCDCAADQAFALGVIEGWAAQAGENELPPRISELAHALREQS
jgi:hypothetical protein